MKLKEDIRLTEIELTPTELRFRKGERSQTTLVLRNERKTKEFTFWNLNPTSEISTAYDGFDTLKIIDLRNEENQLESGRYVIGITRDDLTFKCRFDEYEELEYDNE